MSWLIEVVVMYGVPLFFVTVGWYAFDAAVIPITMAVVWMWGAFLYFNKKEAGHTSHSVQGPLVSQKGQLMLRQKWREFLIVASMIWTFVYFFTGMNTKMTSIVTGEEYSIVTAADWMKALGPIVIAVTIRFLFPPSK